jgi:flotillin
VEEQEVVRRERELDATVRKPAEAERHKVRTLAEARQFQLQTEASGEAEAIRLRGQAEADAARAKGLADAEVIRQKGLAEAEATMKKADAWKEYTQAAIVQQLLDRLPEVASAIAQPLTKTERIVIVNTGSDNGSGAGASRVTQDVANIIAQVPATVEALTGIDLVAAVENLPGFKESAVKRDDGREQSESEEVPVEG